MPTDMQSSVVKTGAISHFTSQDDTIKRRFSLCFNNNENDVCNACQLLEDFCHCQWVIYHSTQVWDAIRTLVEGETGRENIFQIFQCFQKCENIHHPPFDTTPPGIMTISLVKPTWCFCRLIYLWGMRNGDEYWSNPARPCHRSDGHSSKYHKISSHSFHNISIHRRHCERQ